MINSLWVCPSLATLFLVVSKPSEVGHDHVQLQSERVALYETPILQEEHENKDCPKF